MLCERCKIREANIQYTEVINGVKTEHHFCAQCAKEMDFGPYAAIFDGEFPLGKLLSGLLGIGEEQEEQKKAHQVICPACRTSYEEFIKNSRFGCPECYGIFDLLIGENIKQLQGSDTHKGKRPRYHYQEEGEQCSVETLSGQGENVWEGELDIEEQIRILDARLQEAIAREEYEVAAQCRDKIRELKEEIGKC
ncbi:MAG: excinuclease ABC subunit B [Lachnospiraceae bacterium]|jgi:protein arginine kinase activator|nr:excinuclease ABC subunit B [Lachnospiraceae bacterium]MCI9283955.1 excinuclease ABC subunit B [Lachnospiraceae bacterium]